MKEIKIIFNNKDINVQAGEMSGREFLTALGMAFLGGCEKFGLEPLNTIETLMDAEDETKPDPEDYEYWEDWEDDYCDGCGEDFADCECGCTDWGDV